jgi:hypothetical protein
MSKFAISLSIGLHVVAGLLVNYFQGFGSLM